MRLRLFKKWINKIHIYQHYAYGCLIKLYEIQTHSRMRWPIERELILILKWIIRSIYQGCHNHLYIVVDFFLTLVRLTIVFIPAYWEPVCKSKVWENVVNKNLYTLKFIEFYLKHWSNERCLSEVGLNLYMYYNLV